ncbi:hypothetical protein [Streptacidiphilus monticola]|uniref:ABM domain-containing protein n=1 Tax=Streptacidiphilus monticola TaxID=2161674 RepID=A0ABW1FX86_9ACTN
MLIEKWTSRDHLAAHDATEHMIRADAANSAFRAAPAQVIQLVPAPVA